MKLGIAIASIVTVATAVAPASADCDLSRPENIPAAYKRATGKQLPTDSGCVRSSSTFPGLVWVGHFANDRGCIGEGVLVGCALNPPGFAARAMARAGWKQADLATRKRLALAWLREIDGLSLVETKPDDFPKPFAAATATTRGKSTVVAVWTIDPAGMTPVDHYHHITIAFGDDGAHGAAKTIEDVDVRLR
jgi:hypothetical protein